MYSGTFGQNQWLWLISADGVCVAIENDGSVKRTINLTSILEAAVTVTSKVTLTRADDHGPAVLILAIQVKHVTRNVAAKISERVTIENYPSWASFIVAIETTDDSKGSEDILWMVPVPRNFQVKGQISGSSGTETQQRDEIIFYAEETDKSAKIFTVY